MKLIELQRTDKRVKKKTTDDFFKTSRTLRNIKFMGNHTRLSSCNFCNNLSVKYSGIPFIKFFCIILLVGIIFSPSCKKFLEIKPKQFLLNDSAITTLRDLQAVAAGMYDGLQSANVMGGNQILYSEMLAEQALVQESYLSTFGTKEIYEHQTTIQLGALRSMWAESYAVINRANNVIAATSNGTLSGKDFDAAKDSLKGSTFFVRALVMFQLLEFWSLPYEVNNAGGNSQPGIVIRSEPTTSPENLSKARSSVEECYAQIISDFTEAGKLLLKAGIKKSVDRPSEMAASAMLARVFFNKGDYVNAAAAANKVMNTTVYSLDSVITNVYSTTGNSINKEVIFQLVNIAADNSNSLPDNFRQTANTLMLTDTSFTNQFSSSDTRFANLLSKNFLKPTQYFIKKYKKTGILVPNIILMRLAEIYLIHAESNILSGDGNAALTSYNAILKRAMQSSYVEETSTAGLLEKVQLQRELELCFEGDRYRNLRRMKKNVRFGTLYNAPELLFKIPQEEMSGNALMEQNP